MNLNSKKKKKKTRKTRKTPRKPLFALIMRLYNGEILIFAKHSKIELNAKS